MMLCTTALWAQDVTTPEDEAKKKDINNIKLSEMAVYSDVVQMATSEEEAVSLAQQKSIQMMQTHVVEICAKRLHMDKKDVQEIWDVIDDKCQNIVVKKGDLFRVFTYIMKDALHLGPKKPNQEAIDEYFSQEAYAETADQPSSSMKRPTEPIVINVEQVHPETEQAMKEALAAEEAEEARLNAEAERVSQDAEAIAKAAEAQAATQAAEAARLKAEAEAQAKAAEEARLKAESEAKAAEAEAVRKAAIAKAEATVAAQAKANAPALCKTMMAKGNMTELMTYLNQEKAKQTLMYGNRNTMQYADRCYVVIVDKSTKEIVTVLGKGSTDRTNYATGKTDNLVNYRGGNYSAIFVQEYDL
jgi:Icc-related predicted phosphoesterase